MEKANQTQMHCQARLDLIQDFIDVHHALGHDQPSLYNTLLDELWSDIEIALNGGGNGHLFTFEKDHAWTANEVVKSHHNGERIVTCDYDCRSKMRTARVAIARGPRIN